MLRKRLTGLLCLAACVLCLGAQPTCLDAAEQACDRLTPKEKDDLAGDILDFIRDELFDDD